jgi:Zn-dependent protease with chaperone function
MTTRAEPIPVRRFHRLSSGSHHPLARPLAILVTLAAAIGACGVRYLPPAVSEDDVLMAAAARIGRAETPPPDSARIHSAHDDAALLAEVARRLAAAAQPVCEAHLGHPCAFEVALAASETPRAWAAGRGRITVTAGMLRLLGGDADEVAALVGHEMGHHLAGHIRRQLARGTAAGVAASALLGAVVPFGGLAGWALGQGAAELGAGAARLAFSKEEEREADYLAAYLVARAGYDLDRAGWLWARLSRGDGHAPVAVVAGPLETHPAAAERLAAWRRTVAEIRASTDLVPRRARP